MSSRNEGSLLHDIDHAEPETKGKAKSDSAGGPAVPGWAQALVIVAALAVGGFILWSMSGSGNIQEAESRTRVVADIETGEIFLNFNIGEGKTIPYTNPKTGTATLFPTEQCFWTADGRAKLEPTHVVLNTYKGVEGPTMCPDCNRPVQQFNPTPPIELMIEAAGG